MEVTQTPEVRSPDSSDERRWKRGLRLVLIGLVGFAALFLVWQLKWTMTLVVASLLVATFFATGGRLVQRVIGGTATGRGLAVFVVLLVGATAAVGVVIAPTLTAQADRLATDLPQSVDQVRGTLNDYGWGRWMLDQFGSRFESGSDASAEGEATNGGMDLTGGDMMVQPAVWTLRNGITFTISLVFLVFTGLYIAAEPDLYRRGMLRLTPRRHRRWANRSMIVAATTLRHWLYGQLLAMAIVGTLSGLGLWILGVPLPVVNGLLTFALCFVPNFGPIASLAIPALLALTVAPESSTLFAPGLPLALAVVVLYLSIQAVESYLVTPLIQKHAVKLPPALLIVTQLVLGTLLGLVGLVIAAPLMAIVLAVATQKPKPADVA